MNRIFISEIDHEFQCYSTNTYQNEQFKIQPTTSITHRVIITGIPIFVTKVSNSNEGLHNLSTCGKEFEWNRIGLGIALHTVEHLHHKKRSTIYFRSHCNVILGKTERNLTDKNGFFSLNLRRHLIKMVLMLHSII